MTLSAGSDRAAASGRLSRHLAGLLLAGAAFALASAPAAAQEPPEVTGDAFAAPVASSEPVDGNPLPEDGSLPVVAGEQPALAGGLDDDVGRIPGASERLNLPENRVDDLRTGSARDDDGLGMRMGTFVLRPSLSQGLNHERTKTGATTTSRTFSQTGFRGSLTSDWSRHQLTIDADGRYQRNISGEGETEPELNIDADLRLDLSDDTTANLRAGYSFSRESSSDPNAVSGASVQSGVHGFNTGARVTRDFGLIRGTVGLDLEREIYGSAKLADGTSLSLSDRNRTEGTLTGRVGFELSPALIPYLEASIGKSVYDHRTDAAGYRRSGDTLGGRAGVEIDLGEKLRGDLGIGYKRATFEDSRLAAIEAVAVDGSISWSPQRGTDLRLGFATEIEPSTAPGESGYVTYETNAELTHELRENLVARLTGAYTWRDMPPGLGADQNVYEVGAGLTWDINRWLALTGDLSYELTTQAGAPDTGVTRAGIGLVLRR